MDLVGKLFRDGRVKLPVIKRTDELDHSSEVWPLISSGRIRTVRILFCVVTVLITVTAFILPIVGMKLMLQGFSKSLPTSIVAKVLVMPLSSSALLLLLTGLIAYCVLFKKRIPFWVVGIGWVAAYGMFRGLSGIAHDFSHLMFDSCSGYGLLISWIAASAACLITAIWALEFRILRGRYVQFQMAKTKR